MREFLRWWCGMVSVLWLVACAKQSPPPGGPVDDVPPKILEVDPPPGTVRVARDTRVRFRFSEKIDRRSLNDAIFVTPNPGGDLRLDWRGPTLEIKFPDSLRVNTTYVVTLGSGIRDLRNNRLEQSLSVAFSTGDSIATGELHGRVYGEKVQGLLICAYAIDAEDEPDPARREADYTTQSGKSGEFELSYLANGAYRVFAIDDKYGNRLYDRGEDAIGIASFDAHLAGANARVEEMSLRMAMEDTTKPALAAVVATDNRHLEWRFEEPVLPPAGEWFSSLRVLSPEGGGAFAVLAAAPHPLDAKVVHSFTAPQPPGSYRARAADLFDFSGLPLDSLAREVEFTTSSASDTIRPRIVRVAPEDSARAVALDAPVELTFSELMRMDSSRAILAVRDTAGVVVQGSGRWKNRFQFAFKPATMWDSNEKYVIHIFPDSVFDLSGLALFDTVRQRFFWTVNADTLSSIHGAVSDKTESTGGPLRMSAKQIVGGKAVYETTLDAPGPYVFDGVLPGVYQIDVYRDANSNGRYDFGRAFPFLPAERFFVSPDSIKVRSRWPNEGNDVRLAGGE